MRRLVLALGVAATLFVLSLTALCGVEDGPRKTTIEGDSMSPTLNDGDCVALELATSVHRFDIVLYESPERESRPIIGRVIGLPHETVEVRDGAVWINGNRLSEPLGVQPPTYEDTRQLGADEYYILGDNRDNSLDSHIWGPIARASIKGRARD